MTAANNPSAPLTDAIIVAVAQLIDDAQTDRRDPSHSDLEFHLSRAGLRGGDPNSQGQTVGKAKRVRSTLSWALENDPEGGAVFVGSLVALVRGHGGFRPRCVRVPFGAPSVRFVENLGTRATDRFWLRFQPVNATHYSLSNQRSVADETADPLHGESEGADVGALAEGRVAAADRPVV